MPSSVRDFIYFLFKHYHIGTCNFFENTRLKSNKNNPKPSNLRIWKKLETQKWIKPSTIKIHFRNWKKKSLIFANNANPISTHFSPFIAITVFPSPWIQVIGTLLTWGYKVKHPIPIFFYIFECLDVIESDSPVSAIIPNAIFSIIASVTGSSINSANWISIINSRVVFSWNL